MNDWMKLLFIAFDRKTLQVLFDTMIINFRSGVLILWPFFRKVVISKISYFCDGNHTLLKEILWSLSTPYIWLLTNAKSVLPYRKRRKRMNTNDGIDFVTLSRWDTNKNEPCQLWKPRMNNITETSTTTITKATIHPAPFSSVYSCLYPNATKLHNQCRH